MRSLRTILACAVPAVTALFGIFWLFNKRKTPPAKQIAEPPDKAKDATNREVVDHEKSNEKKNDQMVIEEVIVNEAVKVEKLAKLGCGDVTANICEKQTVSDLQNVSDKQNEDDEIISEIDNAFKDIYEGSDVEDEEVNDSQHISVVESSIEAVCKDGLNTVRDATLQSDIKDIDQDKIITRQRADDLNLSSAATTTKSVSERNNDVVEKDEIGLQDEAIVAASAVSLNVAPVPSIDVDCAFIKSEIIEDLVIPTKHAEENVSSEQSESVIESQIITEQFVSQKSLPVNASSHTSPLSDTLSKQESISDSSQKETNSTEVVKCDSKNDEVSDDNDKAVTSGVSSEQNESNELSDWVSDQTKTNSWDEEIRNISQTKSSSWEEETAKELDSGIDSNSWVVNGEIEEVDSKPLQKQTAIENVISGSNANKVASRRGPVSSSAPGAYISREKRGGSVNSSESSSNCDNSSVVCKDNLVLLLKEKKLYIYKDLLKLPVQS